MSSKAQLELDEALYQAADVAEITGLKPKTITNWTDRGLGNPYGGRQGRGRSRLYSGRDLLRFALMRHLDEVGVAIAAMVRMCNSAFGDSFSPRNARYLVLNANRAGTSSGLAWHADLESVSRSLKLTPAALVVNAAEILERVAVAASAVRRRKEAANST